MPATQPQATQKKSKPKPARTKTVKLDGEKQPSSSSGMKRFDPLTAFSKFTPPPGPSSEGSKSTQNPKSNAKGKGKEKAKALAESDGIDDCLWVDKYEPTSEAELAVHVRKVDDVRHWLQEAFEGGPSGKLCKYRRILALTGPAGTGKTTTIRILARGMGCEILEWKNSTGERGPTNFGEKRQNYQLGSTFDEDYEGLFTKFEAFLTRASTCKTIFSESSKSASPKRRLILLEDLPNILHPNTQTQFHEALRSLVLSPPSNPPVPVVVVVSDTGMRGEARDERLADGRGWGKEKDQIVDIRTVLSKDLLGGPYVTEIGFNPIAPTLLRKALQAMLNRHFSSSSPTTTLPPSKEVLDMIVESANGDIRSAIMAIQFACVVQIPGQQKKKGQGKGNTFVMEAVTRREQSLALFHLLGKVMYNKRKDDPPSASATAKDLQKERDIDAALVDPMPLPSHLQHHARRTSRVDVNMLYADSPIDSSLFSLYIHQNYTQFCDEMETVEGVAEWLSWADSSGGEAWYQANPHQFHLLSMGTFHSLPSPVPRRSQKYFKPEFFAFHQKEKDSWHAVRATRDWITATGLSKDDSGWRAGGWAKNDVVLELGGVLKARDAVSGAGYHGQKAPEVHKLFTRMDFTHGNYTRAHQLNENDVEATQMFGDDETAGNDVESETERKGGWLQSDDIEDFD